MAANEFPLNEISIKKLYLSDDKVVYEIPIYQRNYAWEKNEIETLVTDVCDAFFCSKSNDKNYYIGTLVSYKKNDKVYEIIDGQQRLTTIRLILAALFSFGKDYKIKDFGTVFSSLTYRARKKSTDTLKHLPIAFSKEGCNSAVDFDSYECDAGLKNGFDSAVSVLKDKFNTLDENQDAFIDFLLNKVHIIHYVVPKDIDLNHYFEVMNSRGEQLEKHEIIKARLIEKIGNSAPDDNLNRLLLSKIWETCSDMNSYVQQNFAKIKLVKRSDIFGDNLNEFKPKDFDSIIPKNIVSTTVGNEFEENNEQLSLVKILEKSKDPLKETRDDVELKNKFLPVIDFPNFLLVVLKVTYLLIGNHKKLNSLDDKDLLDAFNDYFDSDAGENKIKLFIYNLLKCRFFLDNFT